MSLSVFFLSPKRHFFFFDEKQKEREIEVEEMLVLS
jgi:hypothetical protein